MEPIRCEICTTDTDHAQAFSIREQVFTKEMLIAPDIERDKTDDLATHFLCFVDDEVVGTGRAFSNGQESWIGRMAVLSDFRRQKVGKTLLSFIIQTLKDEGVDRVRLNSQNTARTFYFACGFREVGRPFIEAGIPHIEMELDLTE